ncbi:glutathione S-transferase [Gloeopeniophorella convolvens]|nr:glutathione S-transferase [Gloeopeniophorella convolvens]
MPFKLHGVSLSTCTRRVALVAKERGVPYELVPVSFQAGEHKAAPHVAHQPFGQVPYIEEDGFELFESRAIGRYLAGQGAGAELIPSEPRARARFEQAASVEYSQFDPLASEIAAERVFKAYRGLPADEDRLAKLVPAFEAKLDAYEVILGKQKYLAGEEVTLADLYHLPYGSIVLEQLKIGDLEKRPNVKRWWDDISSRPSWQAVKGGA